MLYLYLDESGDLGFNFSKKRTSQYFIITCLYLENKRSFEKIIKKAHAGISKNIRRKVGVLHCTKEKPVTRRRVLQAILDKKCHIMTIYLNKKKVYTKLQDEKHVLYNYVTNILLDRIFSKKIFYKPIHSIKLILAIPKEKKKNNHVSPFKTHIIIERIVIFQIIGLSFRDSVCIS